MDASVVAYRQAPAPVYPSVSRRLGEQGQVVLRVLVDVHGKAAQTQVEQSSGYRRLDEAAVTAVRRAVFRPHQIDGKPVPVWVLLPFDFNLEE